jgi:predicted nucleic acid-binding protein
MRSCGTRKRKMSISNVRSTVVDIRRDAPRDKDQFLVDTSGWYQLTYTRLRDPKPHYPPYIKRALEAGSDLFCCAVTLIELASIIEANEHRLYQQSQPHVNEKMFRHECPKERATVVQTIKASWSQVVGMSRLVDLTLDQPLVDRALDGLENYLVDGYDLLMAEAMTRRGVLNVITDDGDYASIPDISVFTANAHTIAVAKRQGRLQTRG